MSVPAVAAAFGELPRVDALVRSATFRRALASIEEAERERPWCRHGLAHLLDVARIAWIDALEHGLPLSKDVVYAAALLHDIGRAAQYACGEPHDVAGCRMAAEMLDELPAALRYAADERACIVAAVAGHRGEDADCSRVAGVGDASAVDGIVASDVEVVSAAAPAATAVGGADGPAAVGGADAHAGSVEAVSPVPTEASALAAVIRTADKASRSCWACAARATCHWPEEAMNLSIRV